MWGVYGVPTRSVEVASFMEGLRSLSLPLRERNHNGYVTGQTEAFCPVVVTGLRAQGALIRDDYNALGVPCIIIDYGYMRRVSGIRHFQTGYWQIGINRLGWVPPFRCPTDRLRSLGVTMKTPTERGEAVYVCGQHAGDPSHGLDEDGISEWGEKKIASLKTRTNRRIMWRPHPDSEIVADGAEMSTGPLDWDDVHSIVTINSNIGHDALMRGVPVVCRNDAPYAALASRQFREDIAAPKAATRRRYFARLAYAQWTIEEIRAGLPIKWLMENRLTERFVT